MSDLKERCERAHGMFRGVEPIDHEFAAKAFYESIDATYAQLVQMKATIAEYTMPFTDEFGTVFEAVTPHQHSQVVRAMEAYKLRCGKLEAAIATLYRLSQQ